MRLSIALVIAIALPVLLSGCGQIQQKASETPPRGSYTIANTSAEGTFLLDSQSGKVWRYSVKDNSFLEVVVTGKTSRYERGQDGQLHVVDPKLSWNPKTGKYE